MAPRWIPVCIVGLVVSMLVFASMAFTSSGKRLEALESKVTGLQAETFRLHVAATASRLSTPPDLAIMGTVPPTGGIHVLVFPRKGYDWSKAKPLIERTMEGVYQSHPEQPNAGVTFTELEH